MELKECANCRFTNEDLNGPHCSDCGRSKADFWEPVAAGLTANEYQELAARTINKKLVTEEVELHALFGMVSEIGEIHGIYQKAYQGHDTSEEYVKKELGDLLWFIAEYCTAWGWKLEDVMQLNIDKLRARYPEGFDADKSLHRREGDV